MITNERFKELIEKYYGNMTPDDDYCEILEKVREEMTKEINNEFCLDFSHYEETHSEVIEFILQPCLNRKVIDYVIYYFEPLELTFYAIEYEPEIKGV